MADVSLSAVSKHFGSDVRALDEVSLDIADGEFCVLVGPSGCGKTTALRLIAGLERPTSGEVSIGGAVVNGVPPRDRDIAMVFQNYALYPHMTVYSNLAFGLRERRTPKPEVRRRVTEMAATLGLDDLLRRRPAQLSGGQRQRVAMGRALVREPRVFLLDEPLSNLDAKLRVQMRAELKRLHARLGITTVYVTHDQTEAMTLADRIVVMSAGRVLQTGDPRQVYAEPANLFVAGFIGSPEMNLLAGSADDHVVTAGELRFQRTGAGSRAVVVGVRPEALQPGPAADGLCQLKLAVELVEPLGETTLVHGTVAGLAAHSGAEEERDILADEPPARARVTAVFPAASEVRPGDNVTVSVAPNRLHLFDAATGEAIRATP